MAVWKHTFLHAGHQLNPMLCVKAHMSGESRRNGMPLGLVAELFEDDTEQNKGSTKTQDSNGMGI